MSPAGRKLSRGGRRCVFAFLVFLAAPFFLPRAATADEIRGFLELDFNTSDLKTKDLAGVESATKVNAFTQRYNLTMSRALFPNLILSGGGQFQYDMQDSTTDGINNNSNSSQFSPIVDLLWKTGTIFTDVGYRRREEKSISNGLASPATTNETYSATLGFRPVGYPSLDIIYNRSYQYDAQRITQDNQNDTYSWGSTYNEIKGLDLAYSGTYYDQLNNLNGAQTQSTSQGARVAYSRQFYGNRASVSTTYNLSTTQTNFSSIRSAGTLFLPLPALNSLFATTPTATIPFISVTLGQLPVSGASQVNLVTPVTAAPPPAGTQINMGLSFANPTTVSTIFIPVTTSDQLTGVPNTSPDAVSQLSGFFTWDIYTSSDQQGNAWDKRQTIVNAPFGHNPANPGSPEVGFILNIISVTTQFIKVVEAPPQLNGIIAPLHVNLNSILASTLQAFDALQGTSVKSTSTGGIFGLNARVLLLENPGLSYDMSFFFSHSKADQSALSTQYTLINGLGLAKRLNEVFSMNARVALENGTDTTGISRVALTYSASLMANPLPTLSHTLVYSGRTESIGGATDTSNSVYLNNSAELYKGLSVNAGAGTSIGTNSTGRQSQSTILNCAADIIPHPNLTMSLGYQDSMSTSSGGGQPDASSTSSTKTASAAFRPFETIYLSASYSLINQSNLPPASTQSYSVGWSPFRGGSLQVNCNYSETLSSQENSRTRSLSPTLRWNIRPGASLDFAYGMVTTTDNSAGSTAINSFSSAFRASY